MSEYREKAIEVPFPLRPGFVSSAVVPVDLTEEEAGRMSKWLHSLTVPPNKDKEKARATTEGSQEPFHLESSA